MNNLNKMPSLRDAPSALHLKGQSANGMIYNIPPIQFPQKAFDLSWILQGLDLTNIPNPYDLQRRPLQRVRRNSRSSVTSENKPWGLAINPHNNWIYMADRERNIVSISDVTGKEIGVFGRKSDSVWLNGFHRPTGIAFDTAHNRVLVTDKDNHRISLFSPQGEFIYTFGQRGHQDGQLNYPWGIAVSPNGERIAVADSRNHRVQLFNSHGIFLGKNSEFEKNPFEYKKIFDYPRGVAFDNEGKNIYVTDLNIHTVFKLNETLESREVFTKNLKFNRPQGIKVDPVGNIIICNSRSNIVQYLDLNGELTPRKIRNVECPLDIAAFNGGRNIAVVDSLGMLKFF